MTLYRVAHWSTTYENNRTKELKHLGWVPVPVKLDGNGYLALMDEPDGPALFGAWIAIVETAAKSQPRGTLLRGNRTPHDSASISRVTKMPVDLIARALQFFSTHPMDWLEVAENKGSAGNPAPIPHLHAEKPPLNRTEQNRTEQNEDEDGPAARSSPDRSVGKPGGKKPRKSGVQPLRPDPPASAPPRRPPEPARPRQPASQTKLVLVKLMRDLRSFSGPRGPDDPAGAFSRNVAAAIDGCQCGDWGNAAELADFLEELPDRGADFTGATIPGIPVPTAVLNDLRGPA